MKKKRARSPQRAQAAWIANYFISKRIFMPSSENRETSASFVRLPSVRCRLANPRGNVRSTPIADEIRMDDEPGERSDAEFAQLGAEEGLKTTQFQGLA